MPICCSIPEGFKIDECSADATCATVLHQARQMHFERPRSLEAREIKVGQQICFAWDAPQLGRLEHSAQPE